MKKFLVLLLTVCLAFTALTACGDEDTVPSADGETLKVGFIFLHDENSTYDLNFMNAAKEACKNMGVEFMQKTNVEESSACYEAAADFAEAGCKLIFADSFGHEPFLLQAAKEYPEVQFCHATGTMAHTEKLANFHDAFASIYEGRFLAGVAAGMKLNELGETKMGYVGAFTYAEVISGYTSFYLGAKSVCPNVTMDVQFTGSWYDETGEKEAAQLLISKGCKLISQHADSMGAPTACETAGVPNVPYNASTLSACPNTYIIFSKVNWVPYFEHIIDCTIKGTSIEYDWTGTLQTGSVIIDELNESVAAPGTAEKLKEVREKLEKGEMHVFDTSMFTVGGETLASYQADVDTDEAYTPDTEVIADGYFHESEFRSAPYFDLRIDGITLLNEKY